MTETTELTAKRDKLRWLEKVVGVLFVVPWLLIAIVAGVDGGEAPQSKAGWTFVVLVDLIVYGLLVWLIIALCLHH